MAKNYIGDVEQREQNIELVLLNCEKVQIQGLLINFAPFIEHTIDTLIHLNAGKYLLEADVLQHSVGLELGQQEIAYSF